MRSGKRDYLVECPFSHSKERVYLYYINDAVAFNGCENNFHGCRECEDCRIKAQQMFEQEDREGKLPHGHTHL